MHIILFQCLGWPSLMLLEFDAVKLNYLNAAWFPSHSSFVHRQGLTFLKNKKQWGDHFCMILYLKGGMDGYFLKGIWDITKLIMQI